MDAVELPLPTTVVTKLLTPEGFGRVRESETRDSGAGSAIGGGDGVPQISSEKPSSSCVSFHRDAKYPDTVKEDDPIPRNEKGGDRLLENATSSKHKENGIGKKAFSVEIDISLRSCPKYDSKQVLHKKHVKMRSSPKQGRNNQSIVSTSSYTIKGCIAGEKDKARIVKSKQRQESKRGDRKAARTAMKAIFDSFLTNDSLVNPQLAVTGSNAFGAFGARFDLLDVAKNVNELSLTELLDGKFKCPNVRHDKVKKASNANENILSSVSKAVSIIAIPITGVNSGSRKASGNPTSADCDVDKITEDPAVSCQVQGQSPFCHSALYQPKDVLERLVLPASQDLSSIMVDSSSSMVPPTNTGNVSKASLPHFPWSVSGGPFKPTADNSKSATTRSTYQGRWVRIGSTPCLSLEERFCFSDLDLKIEGYNEASQHLIDYSLNLETSKLSEILTSNVQNGIPFDANAILKSSDITPSKTSHTFMNCCDPFNTAPREVDASGGYQLGFKDVSEVMDMEKKKVQNHYKIETVLSNQSISNLHIQEKIRDNNMVKDVRGNNGKNYCASNSSLKGTDRCLSYSAVPEESNSDYSPRLLAAAGILCDIASTKKRNHAGGKAILSSVPSQTASKTLKTRPFIVKSDGFKHPPKTGDPTRRINRISSPEHVKPAAGDDKSKIMCTSSVARGPIRWSAADNKYSSKFGTGKDLTVKPMQSSPVGLMGHPPLLPRAERGYDGHRKHRSSAVVTSSVTAAPAYLNKDWRKGRHRRE